MKWFNKFFERVEHNKRVKEEGGFNCIPLPFDRLGDRFPGIQQGKYVIISANSGVGKTQITKYLYVFWPFIWCRENKTDITFKCKYFALEESKEEFIASAYSFFLYYYYQIECDPDDIFSMYTPLGKEVITYMEKLQDIMDEFLDSVEVIDSIFNPFGIYSNVREYSRENGTHYYYNFREDRNKENPITIDDYLKLQDKSNYAYSHYVPNRPDEYFTVVVDHIGLLSTERDTPTLHEAIRKMSADYGRKHMTKQWNYIFVNVQQQNSKSEYMEFDNRGKSIVDKLKPSLSELANNTETQRDALVAWGLFSPNKYDIPLYRGRDIKTLKNNFRELKLLKNRGGTADITTHLYFNGASNYFKELPQLESHPLGHTTIQGVDEKKWHSEFKKNKEFWL